MVPAVPVLIISWNTFKLYWLSDLQTFCSNVPNLLTKLFYTYFFKLFILNMVLFKQFQQKNTPDIAYNIGGY